MPQYIRKDRFYNKAKEEGYVSRSAYKLIELDKRFGILKPGKKIVDLGCAPGGWIQVAEKKMVKVFGIDLLPLHYQPGPNVTFVQGNFLDIVNQQNITDAIGDLADWVLSDMSPNLSGIKFKDLQASVELSESAFEFAKINLKKGGSFVVKIFPGPELEEFKKKLKNHFLKVSTFIPDATRKSSIEIYLLGLSLKSSTSTLPV